MDKRTGGFVVAVLSIVLLFPAGGASAQFLGAEFRVTTTTTDNQRFPAVAFDGSGDFVVVWQSGSAPAHAIFGQRYSSSGAPLGGEFRVNTDTAESHQPAVASDAAGNFVVVWTSNQGASSYDILGQRFDSSGAPRGSAFVVNTYTTGYQISSTVASDSTGNLVVAWRSNGQTGAGSIDVFGQRYATSGAPIGAEFEVSVGGGLSPSVASDAAGNFVVAWQGVSGGAYAQRFSSTGIGSGSFTVSLPPGMAPSAGMNGAGDFVITWTAADASLAGVFAQRYAPDATPLGPSFQVNTFTTGGQAFPHVAIGEARAFAVTWNSLAQDGSLQGVFGRPFASTGGPLEDDDQINTYTTERQQFPVIGTDGVGHFVIAWESYGQDGPSSWGVYAHRFAFCRPGDVDGSSVIDVADVFYLINTLFAGGPPPVCSGDVNANGSADVADVFYLINYLFAGGPAPK